MHDSPSMQRLEGGFGFINDWSRKVMASKVFLQNLVLFIKVYYVNSIYEMQVLFLVHLPPQVAG